MSFVKNHIYVLSCIVGTDGGSLLIRVSFVKNHIYVLSCIVGSDGGSHSSLGCHLSKITFMFCHVLWGQMGGSLLIRVSFVKKSHLCFVMHCGDRRGSHSSLGCVICQKITFMFCHALWGQTGVSLLIRVCHLSKITFMFCHVLWGQAGGHSSLGCVICQKSHL